MTNPPPPPAPEPPKTGQDAGMRLLLPVGRSVWAIIAAHLGLVAVLLMKG